MLVALLAAIALGAGPTTLDWLPAPPRALNARTLVGAGEDARTGVLVQGTSLVVWDLATGKRRLTGRLPNHRWHTLSLAPLTDGESERAVIASDRHVVLVHLRTGRLVASWPVRGPSAGRALTWSPDGGRVALVGWELPGLDPSLGAGLPVLWVDAETGTVVSQLRLPEPIELRGLASLGDGRSLAIGTPRRLLVLGPGPTDARTIGIACDQLVGGAREGLVVLRRGVLIVVDERSGTTATELAKVRMPVALEPGLMMSSGGRWAIGRWGASPKTTSVLFAIDLVRRRVVALAPAALGSPHTVVPSLDGVIALGRRPLAVPLAADPPAAIVVARLCIEGDCQSGQGAEVDLIEGHRFRGGFRAGEPSGQGVLHFADGAIYSGPFVRGKPHGEGKLLTSRGDERRVRAVEGELTTVP